MTQKTLQKHLSRIRQCEDGLRDLKRETARLGLVLGSLVKALADQEDDN